MPLNGALDIGDLVSRLHREVVRVLANSLVRVLRDREQFHAGRIGALAHDLGARPVQLVDALVDLAKERLVSRGLRSAGL